MQEGLLKSSSQKTKDKTECDLGAELPEKKQVSKLRKLLNLLIWTENMTYDQIILGGTSIVHFSQAFAQKG